ncbi:MAG: competence/damage-inducible protein A [Oscillospiraceae bacterium]|jgi:nicotinamide-nucleotide amidase|nr:competence/damage-inducible protein A [Oscillospiraceae bacterium]
MSKTAEIVAIGTELLLGNIANTDAQVISQALSEIGINVYFHTVVGDNPQRIIQALELAKKRADIIITTGGLGPTYDDITKETVAGCFGLKLVRHEETVERLHSFFKERGAKYTANNESQAMLPEGCTVFRNDWGTAPGCAFEAGGSTVIMLPGPPSECVPMLKFCAVPYLERFADAVMVSRNIRVYGMGESAMENAVRDLIVSMENPTVAPYALTGECRLRVTAKAATREEAYALTEPVIKQLTDRLGDVVYGIDVESLEETVVSLLRENNCTLATAESCTGGLLSGRITSVPGSSAVFLGGICAYSNDVKTGLLNIDREVVEKHGAVSAEVAVLMAENVRRLMKSDVGVGVTGVAGPGESENKPAGTVFVAVSSGEYGSEVAELKLGSGRERVRSLSVLRAMDMVRRHLLNWRQR